MGATGWEEAVDGSFSLLVDFGLWTTHLGDLDLELPPLLWLLGLGHCHPAHTDAAEGFGHCHPHQQLLLLQGDAGGQEDCQDQLEASHGDAELFGWLLGNI